MMPDDMTLDELLPPGTEVRALEIPVWEASPTVQGTEENLVFRPQDDQPQASQTGNLLPGQTA